jgi:hypothetical protein
MTTTHNTVISGHILRKAHEEVGYHLTNELLGDVLSAELYSMMHVAGGTTGGYHLHKEEKTLIVPLTHSSYLMACAVSKA